MQNSPVGPRYLETANENFTRAVIAALVLGEVRLLDYSVEWLHGLLENYGMPTDFATHYFHAFHRAMLDQPNLQAGPVLEWLEGFVRMT
jgi:hypothetical protein